MTDGPPYVSYRTEQRREELLRLGLSQSIVRLALFDLPHPLFCTRCEDLGPPQLKWRARQPSGSPVAYRWCFRRYHRLVTGVRLRGSRWTRIMSRLACQQPRLEFILFRPDAIPAGHVVVARSEQGLLASTFSGLIADQHGDRDMWIEQCGVLPFPQEEDDAEVWNGWIKTQNYQPRGQGRLVRDGIPNVNLLLPLVFFAVCN
jgi:hypothetical protein